ncbi:MAG: hypothetical protein V3T86_07225 [Planctomycetota bacterium]
MDGALAAVKGGGITSERLLDAARRAGRDRSRLVRRLVERHVPSSADLARAYLQHGGVPKIDRAMLRFVPKSARLLDLALMRELRCVPLEVFDDVCVLGVVKGYAERAVREVRPLLKRDLYPVLLTSEDVDALLNGLPGPERARPNQAAGRTPSPVHERFRSLVLARDVLDALPAPERD